VRLVIHAEGGGDAEHTHALFRRAWVSFFARAALPRRPRVIPGGGRDQTIANFLQALEDADPETRPLLLVDSEGPVEPDQTAWEYLQTHGGSRIPASARDQVFLMVQLMETWFLADRETLRRYFGRGFRENVFRAWPDLEAVPKNTVLRTLEQATADCRKPYAKGKVSFDLLGQVNPALVENACLHAKQLLNYLRNP
jgi:hypothetical protein